MSHNQVKVRAIRPHDTVDGTKAPGDEYERDETDAKMLAAMGVLELVAANAPAKSKRK